MDCIRLEDITVQTHIGVEADERSVPQTLLVTIELRHPLSDVAGADDVSGGIDYALVTEAVVKLGETERRTIERFAEDVAQIILSTFKPEGGVRITVRKTPALPLTSTSVTIERP